MDGERLEQLAGLATEIRTSAGSDRNLRSSSNALRVGIGRSLLEAQALLAHQGNGEFQNWIQREFVTNPAEMARTFTSLRTAYRRIEQARLVDSLDADPSLSLKRLRQLKVERDGSPDKDDPAGRLVAALSRDFEQLADAQRSEWKDGNAGWLRGFQNLVDSFESGALGDMARVVSDVEESYNWEEEGDLRGLLLQVLATHDAAKRRACKLRDFYAQAVADDEFVDPTLAKDFTNEEFKAYWAAMCAATDERERINVIQRQWLTDLESALLELEARQ